jgi:hypothetical protein
VMWRLAISKFPQIKGSLYYLLLWRSNTENSM